MFEKLLWNIIYLQIEIIKEALKQALLIIFNIDYNLFQEM